MPARYQTFDGIDQDRKERQEESVRLLVLYAALIAATYPAFYFFTRWTSVEPLCDRIVYPRLSQKK
ncbi:MAG: hypothetical protein M3R30_08475 [Candidatus Eremiobacteraeota bacterium]|nr:hypothetical protein [Candidatus Eremiobacteraeota bacterium]